jgi:hypothetical protein
MCYVIVSWILGKANLWRRWNVRWVDTKLGYAVCLHLCHLKVRTVHCWKRWPVAPNWYPVRMTLLSDLITRNAKTSLPCHMRTSALLRWCAHKPVSWRFNKLHMFFFLLAYGKMHQFHEADYVMLCSDTLIKEESSLFGVQRRVGRWKSTEVSEEHIATIIRVE